MTQASSKMKWHKREMVTSLLLKPHSELVAKVNLIFVDGLGMV
jgi:hypothetical protein